MNRTEPKKSDGGEAIVGKCSSVFEKSEGVSNKTTGDEDFLLLFQVETLGETVGLTDI